MNAKRCTTLVLAVLVMAGMMMGCSSVTQGRTGKTEVTPLGAGKAMQVWRGELNDGATEEQVLEHAQNWLAGAKKVKGGENLEMYVKFPVVVNATGEVDLLLILVAPTFKEWGRFWDAYGDSDAADQEVTSQEHIVFPNSTMWESFKVNAAGEAQPADSAAAGATIGKGRTVQWLKCELVGDATRKQVLEQAQKWLAAARTMKGGKNLRLFVNFPVVVNAPRNADLILMLVAPNFEEWGEFKDSYGESAVRDVEKAGEKILVISGSAMWEAFRVEDS